MLQLVVNMWVEVTGLPGSGIELAGRVASKDVLSGPAVTQQSDTESALSPGKPDSDEEREKTSVSSLVFWGSWSQTSVTKMEI